MPTGEGLDRLDFVRAAVVRSFLSLRREEARPCFLLAQITFPKMKSCLKQVPLDRKTLHGY
jgi:hypothetical protein